MKTTTKRPKFTKVFTRSTVITFTNFFNAKDTLSIELDCEDIWDVPKEAKHIQFRVSGRKTVESVPIKEANLCDSDFVNGVMPKRGYVQLLWW